MTTSQTNNVTRTFQTTADLIFNVLELPNLILGVGNYLNSGYSLSVQGVSGLPLECVECIQMKPESTIEYQVYKTKQKKIVSKVNFEKNLSFNSDIFSKFKSAVIEPIINGERVIGIIEIFLFVDVTDISENIILKIDAIVKQAAFLFEKQSEVDKYKALVDSIREISSKETDIDRIAVKEIKSFKTKEIKIFKTIYQQVKERLNMPDMSIALYDKYNDKIEFVLISENGALKPNPNAKKAKDHKKSNEVIQSKREVYYKDRNELKEVDGKIVNRKGSWLGVPIILRGEIIGIIAVYDMYKPYRFNDNDIYIVKSLAFQAAIAIKNSRLYDNLNKEVRAKTAKLEEEHNTLKTLINSLPSHIYFKDTNSRFRIANNAVIRSFGKNSESEIIDKTDHDLHKESHLADRFSEDEKQIFITGKPLLDHEEKIIDNSGNERFLSTNKIPVRDENGRIYGLIGINHNITELKCAFEISEAAHNSKKLDDLYPKIYKTIKKLMNPENFYITLKNKANEKFFIPFFKDIKYNKYELELFAQKGLSSFVFNTQRPLISNPEFRKQLVDEGKVQDIESPAESWLGVPLKTTEGIIGVLAVQSYTKDVEYSEADMKMLMYISEQIAMAIERVRTGEELRKYQQQLEELVEERTKKLNDSLNRRKALEDLSRDIAATIEPDALFKLIHQRATDIGLYTDNMYIALFDENNYQISFPLAYKLGLYQISFPLAYKNGKKINIESRPFGNGRTEEIIKTGEPILIKTRKESEEWYLKEGREEYINDPLSSWVGVPIKKGSNVIGVIANFHPKKEYVYDEDDQNILQSLANMTAVAFDNARLIKGLNRTKKELQRKVSELEKAQNDIANKERELAITGVVMDFIHKMNNIAGTIPPWITLIERKMKTANNVDKKVYEFLNKIKKEANLILKEANSLKNKPSEEKENLNIVEVVGSIIAQVELMASPDIIIGFDSEFDSCYVYAAYSQLASAIYNIVDNSIKAISLNTEQEGKLDVKIYRDNKKNDKNVIIEIKDSGIGIPANRVQSIFKYGNSFWKDYKGSGYGLWRTKTIIQSIGGNVQVSSKEGKGSSFKIILPINN